jgi:hypothetical protein
MEMWLTIIVIVVAVASRPIEVRLWRAGRLSDRTLTLLLIGRFPVLVGVFAVLSSEWSLVTLFLIAISLLPGPFVYRFTLGFIKDQHSQH